MRYTAVIMFIFLTVLMSGRQAHCQDNFEVHGLEIKGNSAVSDARLKACMSTYATGGFGRTFLGKESFLYSSDILAADLRNIVRCYQREGFLFAGAELSDLSTDNENRTVRITIQIDEGDSVSICSNRWIWADSNEAIDPIVDSVLSDLFRDLKARPGTKFRDAAVDTDRRTMVSALENVGYAYCEAVPTLAVDEPARTVDITWNIRPGRRCTFGDIQITGNVGVSDRLIRNSVAFGPGEIYSRKKLEETQRRIYDLSVFHIATASATLTSNKDSVLPVDILVREAPRLTSKIGVGYGREEKFRVYSDSYILRFLGGARRLNLYVKHSDLEPYHVSLRFTQPVFPTRHTTLELNPFLLRQKEPAFTQNRYGSNVSLLHQFSRPLLGSITHSFERVSLDTTSVADVDLAADQLDDLYNKSSLSLGLTFDNSTPTFSPTHGFYAASAFKISGLGLGSDYHFTRLLWDLRRYQPLLGMVIAGRVKIGGVRSSDFHEFVPVEDRFYSGGSASVRGWARAELGPMVDDIPVGGNSLFETSLELRYPILGIISGAMFSDFGNVWLPSYSFHLDDLRYSAGVGVRVSTPIGPVRLDVARPIFDDETTVQVHLSVGEAF